MNNPDLSIVAREFVARITFHSIRATNWLLLPLGEGWDEGCLNFIASLYEPGPVMRE